MNLHVMDNKRISGIKRGRITTWNPTLILNVYTHAENMGNKQDKLNVMKHKSRMLWI